MTVVVAVALIVLSLSAFVPLVPVVGLKVFGSSKAERAGDGQESLTLR